MDLQICAMQAKEDLFARGISMGVLTEALLNDADPRYGGGVRTSFRTEGNSDCSIP